MKRSLPHQEKCAIGAPSLLLRVRGVTIVELMVVIVVIFILSSISLGVYSPSRRDQAAASALDKFTSAINKARTSAVADGFSYRVTVRGDNSTFWVDRTGNTPAEQTAFDLRGQTAVDPVTGDTVEIGSPKVVPVEPLPVDVTISEIRNADQATVAGITYSYFIFNPDGSSPNSSGIEFISSQIATPQDRDYYSLRIFGPSGTIEKRNRQPLP